MDISSNLQNFCKDQFWEPNVTWSSDQPKLTQCLSSIGFTLIPNLIFWLLVPLELINIFKSKNRKINFNFFNTIRLLLCVFGFILSAYQIIIEFNEIVIKDENQNDVILENHYLLSDFFAAISKLLTYFILFVIFIYHRTRGIITSGVIWTFLLFNSVCAGIIVADIYFYNQTNYHQAEIKVIILNFLFNSILFIFCSFTDDAVQAGVRKIESVKDQQKIDDKLDKDILEDAGYKQSPESYASFPNRLFFSWFTKIVWFGRNGGLTTSNLWNLEDKNKIDNILNEFSKSYKKELEILKKQNKDNTKRPYFSALRLLKVFINEYGLYFLGGTIAKFTHDCFQFANPQLLKLLITFIKDSEHQLVWHGFLIVIFMLFVGVMKSLMINLYFERMMSIGMRLKSNIINLVYTKSLRLSSIAKKERTTGEIVNLISVDANRFLDVLTFLNLVWSAPMQIILGIYFLYQELGMSVFAGVACIVAVIPINAYLINFQKKIQLQQMKHKDERVKLMNEILSGIKILKLYGWESKFMDNVNDVRSTETGFIKKSYLVNLASSFFFTITTVMISVTTFAVYIFSSKDNILTPEKAFTSITLFSILQFPIFLIPNLVNFFILAHVALKRITKFLNAEELTDYVSRDFDKENAVCIEGKAIFTWDIETNDDKKSDDNKDEKNSKDKKKKDDKNGIIKEEERQNGVNGKQQQNGLNTDDAKKEIFALKDIEYSIKKGSFVAIIGQVGSGKTSLLSALLGEMQLREDKMKNKCKVNISEEQIISYAAQQAWIQNETLRNNILFGKKFDSDKYYEVIKCCALEPDIEILPGKDLVEIGEKGINLSGGQKQRINLARVCYSSIDVDDPSKQLILLDDPLSAVDAHVGKHLIENVLNSKTGILKNTTRILVTNQLQVIKTGYVDQILIMKDGKIQVNCTYDELMEMDKNNELTKFGISLNTNESSSDEEDNEKEEKETKKNDDQYDASRKLIEAEKLETQEVSLKDYIIYIKNAGMITCFIILLLYIVEHALTLGANIFLSKWTDTKFNMTEENKDKIYEFNKAQLGYYTLINCMQCLANSIGNFFLIIAAISSAIKFHKQLIYGVLRSPMSFFDTTPLGRIINKFAKDIDVIDSIIPGTVRTFISCMFRVIAALLIIVYTLPLMGIPMIFVFIFYYIIQKLYVATSRQLKRLESIARSPIFSHFSETITGASTIRAYNANERFTAESNLKIDVNNKCYWLSIIGYRWLGLRLDFIGNVVVFLTAALVVYKKDSLDAGSVGLIVSYSMNVTQLLTWAVRMISELETNVVSIERINEYVKNKEEDSWEKEYKPPMDWPSKGIVEFKDYSARYREGTNLVLKDLNVKFDSLDKVGIVGRTGAGKSTITLALFRTIEPASGCILVDDIDITKLGLHDLRSKLSIIPQDPVLFSGTIRFNLDPFNKYSDEEIWKSLESAHLKNYVLSLEGGLEYKIAEGGENLSVGQRQLICLARALLKKSKILVLDEATASVDFSTDELIQKTIRSNFNDCTTITIAHRINTILDSTKILVLDKGENVEYDDPKTLLDDPNSLFYQLAKSANAI